MESVQDLPIRSSQWHGRVVRHSIAKPRNKEFSPVSPDDRMPSGFQPAVQSGHNGVPDRGQCSQVPIALGWHRIAPEYVCVIAPDHSPLCPLENKLWLPEHRIHAGTAAAPYPQFFQLLLQHRHLPCQRN